MTSDHSNQDNKMLPLFSEFMENLYFFSRIFQKYEQIPQKYSTDAELFMKEMHTLQRIFDNEGITISELAALESVTQSAASQKINKLEKKGFVIKKRNPDEYKKINLFATEKGKTACAYHLEYDKRIYSALIQRLGIEDIQENEQTFQDFIQLLKTLSSGLENHVEDLKKQKE